MLRSPRQASNLYVVGDGGTPRSKRSFAVTFHRASPSSMGSMDIPLTYYVKSADMPSVQPQIEDMNQYNKKRVAYTGWKQSPVKIVFYDTADSAAVKMWNDYAKHYFGDFRQQAGSWAYDVTAPQVIDNGSGFGFSPRAGSSNVLDLATGFYFDRIEIVNIASGGAVTTTIINPKITSFDPDTYDYEDGGISMITITLTYEAIQYAGGTPTAAEKQPFVTGFKGGALNLPGGQPAKGVPKWGGSIGENDGYADVSSAKSALMAAGKSSSGLGGGLGMFGNFNFGGIVGSVVNSVVSGRGVTAGLSNLPYMMGTGNPVLSTVINAAMGRSQNPLLDIGSAVLGSNMRPTGVSSVLWDAAQAGIQASVRGGNVASGAALGTLAAGIVNSLGNGGSGITRSANGVSLSSDALQFINNERPDYAQYGFNGGSNDQSNDGNNSGN